MAAHIEPPHGAFDWRAIRGMVARRMGYHLRGWEPSEIEDATQDVLVRLMRFIERSGPPDSMDALALVVARRTALERMRTRSRRPRTEAIQEDAAVTADEATHRALLDLEDDVAWKALQVREYFRKHQAPCLELAEARSQGVDLKQVAGQTGQSHDALLQRWSRCMKRLRTAIANGELQWERP